MKGRFMSPVVALCNQNHIPVKHVGRNLIPTSSRLSTVAFTNPWQFYKLLWLLLTKSWTLIRTPSARDYLASRVPVLVDTYLREGSECMALKIFQNTGELPDSHDLVAVVPLENYPEVTSTLEAKTRGVPDLKRVAQRTAELEQEGLGLWIPVFLLYLFLPCYSMYWLVTGLMRTELTELDNYETQGIALGTWVRDKRRD